MSRRFLTPLNVLHLATPPSSPSLGDVYFDTTYNALYTWDGSEWVSAGLQGAQGIQGTEGLGITFQGAWDSGTFYPVNDAVTYSGNTYVAHRPSSSK